MPDNKLKQREMDILSYIKFHLQEKGYPPTVREIGQAVGLKSSSTVHNYLHKMVQKGVIRLDKTKPRAIEILVDKEEQVHKEMINVPILGQVAAGIPLLAEENLEDIFPLPIDFTGRGDLFMLRVKGDSMIEAGILEDDMVLIRSQPKVENGDIAVAMIEGEATVKRFYKDKDHIRLEAENSSFSPIITKDAEILGKVVALIRSY